MKLIKTYEGFFNFLSRKKLEPLHLNDIKECLYDITDEYNIKTTLYGNGLVYPSWDFVFKVGSSLSLEDEHDSLMNDMLYRNSGFKMMGNAIAFNITWNTKNISDDSVDNILQDCIRKLDLLECKLVLYNLCEWGGNPLKFEKFTDFINSIRNLDSVQRYLTIKIESRSGFA